MTIYYPNEYDLIAKVEVSPHPEHLAHWRVVIRETGGISYPLQDHYADMNLALEQARIVDHMCRQPITIQLVQENGDTVTVDCEKMTKLDVVALTRKIYIYFNGKTNGWEVFSSNGHTSSIADGFNSDAEAAEAANLIMGLNPECEVVRQIADNTCRARGCVWNVDDSCMLKPRSSLLPPASVDMTIVEWTELNHPTPRSCMEYTPIEQEWT